VKLSTHSQNYQFYEQHELSGLVTYIVFLTPFASLLLLLPTVVLCHCRLRSQLRRLVLFLDAADVFKIFGNVFAYLVFGDELSASL
jgi:uncharacterized membrane protein YhaH (DUF805 family)